MSSRALAWIFGVSLVVALLVIAFMVGRQSSDRGPAPMVAAPTEPAAEEELAPPTAPSAAEAPAIEAAAAPEQPLAVEDDGTRLERRAGELIISNTAERAATDETPSADSAALSGYLDALADLEAGPTTDNPQAFAQDLAASAMGGDTSRLDALAKDIARAEEKARSIVPPAEAVTFHSQVIAQLGESRAMIEQLSAAFQAKDPGALGKLVDRAKSLEDRAREIEATKKALERKAGRR